MKTCFSVDSGPYVEGSVFTQVLARRWTCSSTAKVLLLRTFLYLYQFLFSLPLESIQIYVIIIKRLFSGYRDCLESLIMRPAANVEYLKAVTTTAS